MKLWIDDVRPAPEGYIWIKSVNQAKTAIKTYELNYYDYGVLIDIDHDAGNYFDEGGDYIKFLDRLESEGYVDEGFTFHIHSMNVVGRMNMETICKRNNWTIID